MSITMSDALVTVILTQLTTILDQQIRKQIRLVVGVTREINNLTTTFQSIQAVLADADKRQVHEEAVKLWLQRLRDASYEVDDVLSEWTTAILKVQLERLDQTTNSVSKKKKVCFFISFPCFSIDRVATRRDIALKIKNIAATLDSIALDKDRYKLNSTADADASTGGEQLQVRVRTTSAVDESKVRGRDEVKGTLVSKLCDSNEGNGGLHIVSIVGMGGIGKTTLAQLVYDEVTDHFEKKMWVCVSETFDEVRVAKAIVEDAEGKPPDCVEYEVALRKVRESVAGKKFMLVLDDVWSEEYERWEPLIITLKKGAPGSKILVTTRNEKVAKIMGATYSTIRLGFLSKEDCWSLFHQIAFSERSVEESIELEDVGRRIAGKCKGLPLAAKTIGSLMRFKATLKDWQNVLDSEIWQMGEAERGLFPPLLLSYYDLPSAVKRCFSYCASFPKDCKIEAENLIKIWMAQGYLSSKETAEMEITGRDYLDTLIMRSFFQYGKKDKEGDVVVRFKMHDMVHDFARYLTKNECFIMEANGGAERGVDSTWQNLRHLTIVRGDEAKLPVPPDNTERLHTFWVQSFYDSPPIVIQNNSAPTALFHHLKYLKVLDLSRNRLTELPGEVGQLMNLRYLNLSHNPLFELPETVCGLCNLQTLKLVACDHLAKLPPRLEKLANLRHLEIDRSESLRTLPRGIGMLTSLRTLSKFIIGSGGDTEEASCKLGDLKDLKHLRGSLKIEGVGHVADVHEAEKAELKNKGNIVDLHIDFSTLVPAKRAIEMIEALQLHTNVQNLQMKLYGGLIFPNWMISLASLRKLRLLECGNCIKLPPLGKLPSLEILYIESFHNLIRVDHEFLGVESDDRAATIAMADGQTAGSSPSFVAFPKLKKLKFAHMRSWEEWDMIGAERVMPYLLYLKLSHCDKLKTLPQPLLQIAQLQKFRVHDCPILHQRYQKETGEDWNRISHIPKIRII